MACIAAGTALASTSGESRVLDPKTAAWWTFDSHLKDQVHGIELSHDRHPDKDTEELYSSIQYVPEVPLLEIGGRTNWRSFYRWGQPHLVRGSLGDELDAPGPFTIEGYLKPRDFPGTSGCVPQKRAYVLRKVRLPDGEPQWSIEIRRDSANQRNRADLFASVAFRTAGGDSLSREVTAKNAVQLSAWQHFAVMFDGAALAIAIDGNTAATVKGPGQGARLLPSEGQSQLLLSDTVLKDGRKVAPDKRHLLTSYEGRIDELRVTFAALSAEQLLPPARVYDGKQPLPVPPVRKELTSIVRKHLDILMEHGTDRYGPVHSPLLASALDPETRGIVKMKPPQGEGMPFVGDNYRSPVDGCNLTLMRNTLMAMRSLSAVTGEPRYAHHADDALRFWLNHCPYPSGAWPIGEHGVWNFHTDRPEPNRPHEPSAHLDWPRYWEIAPGKVRKELELTHTVHVFQYKGLAFHGRHGSSAGSPHTVGGLGFARHSGLFARDWAFLYSKTKDRNHLQWAEDQVELLWQLRDPKTGFCPTQVFPPPGETHAGRTMPSAGVGTQPIWAALGLLDAAQWIDDPAVRERFHDRAVALAMPNFKLYYQWDGTAFQSTRHAWMSSALTPDISWLLLKFWERSGRSPELLEHLRRIANDRLQYWLPTEGTDSGCYGYTILFFIQLYNETGEQRYLDFARRLGDYAAANLVLENGLVVGSRLYRYYDRMYHVPKLVQAFLALDHPKHPAIETLLREPLL